MLPRGCPRAVALPCWAATQILQRARRPTWDDMSIGKMTESDVPGAQGSPAPFVKTQGAGPECVTPGSRLQQERSEGGDGERTQVTSEGRKGQDCGVWSSGAGREQGSRGAGCRPGKGRSDGTLPLPLPAWLLLGNGPLGTGQWAVTSGQWVTLANVGKCKWVRVQVVSECGQRAFTDALHPSTLPHPPPLFPSHAPLPTLQRDSLRPWPCETALCRRALLISSLPLSPSKVEGRTTTPPVENCWMVRKTTAIPPTSPDPDPGPDPDHTAGSLSRSNASRRSSFFLLSQHPLPTTIRHHPTTPPRTLPSGLPSLSGHTACKKAGKSWDHE